jgi:hypothetical protein
MSEIFAPGAVAGPAGAPGAAGAAGSLANVKSLTDGLSLATANLFNYAAVQSNFITNSDGTVSAATGYGGGPSYVTPLMYCPAATELKANYYVADTGFGSGAYIQLFDANGGFLTVLAPMGSWNIAPGTTITLPGTQTYVRLSLISGPPANPVPSYAMIVAGTSSSPATIPGSFQEFGLDTVADVSSKDTVVAANAAAALSAALTNVPAAFAGAVLPGGPLGTRNAFNWQGSIPGQVNADGSVSDGGGYQVATIYCPNATSFISNLPFEINASVHNICTYDCFGNFLANINANITPTSGGGYFPVSGTLYALPGNQTYVKVCYYPGHFGSAFPGSPRDCVFYAGNSASPCPSTITDANRSIPFLGFMSVTSRKATEMGAVADQSIDATTILNTYLATASASNPIELILDGVFYTTGLVISPNGYTTIRGLGAGTGIVLPAGGVQDGIRIGAYTSGTGSSEGTHGTPPTRSTKSIVLRDFQIFPNGQQNAAANQPITGAIAHGTYGVILASCSDVQIDSLTFSSACANYCVTLTNVDHVNVRNCSFTTGGTVHDGVHIDGPSEKIHISNCTFATGDDAIALNAYEGYCGDITDVTIDSCIFVNSLTLMRGYGSAAGDSTYMAKISRVAISNCTGSVASCVASLGLSAGGCNLSNVDEIRDITFSNCDITHGKAGSGYAPFLLACNVRALKINNHIHRPLTAVTMIQSFGNVVDATVNDLTIVRGDDANAACAIVDVNAGSGIFQKLTLRGLQVADQTGSSYTALPYVVGATTALAELVVDALDMDKFTALFDSHGTTNITTIKGSGVLGTGTAVPDSVMANNSLYLSSTASSAPSIKVGGTAKRLTLA